MPDVRVGEIQALIKESFEAIGSADWLTAAYLARKAAEICDEMQEVAFRERRRGVSL